MKKIYLTLLCITLTRSVFAQAGGGGYSAIGTLVGFLLGLAFLAFLFLILRQVMLWYWKVDKIVKNQEEQNNLLRAIYNSLEENKKRNEGSK